MHPDSQVDLLVHNLDVHDVLAECAKVAGKTASLNTPDRVLQSNWKVNPEERLKPAREGKWTEIYDKGGLSSASAPCARNCPGRRTQELLKMWRQRRDDAIWNNGLP